MEEGTRSREEWEKLVQRLIHGGVLKSLHVIKAFRRVSREHFVPERVKSHATFDSPLPIGFKQTISAPLG